MGIEYATQFYPFLECTLLLCRYVEKRPYKTTKETTAPFWHEADCLLEELSEAMGELLENRYPKQHFLFQKVKKEFSSIAELLFYAADYTCVNSEDQMHYFKKQLAKDPFYLLRLFVEDNDDRSIQKKSERELLDLLEETYPDADVRWQLLKVSQYGEQMLEDIGAIIGDAEAIYHTYDEQLKPYYAFFVESTKKEYEHGDMFHDLLAEHQMQFEDNGAITRIIPLLAERSMLTISQNDLSTEKNTIVYWGIDIVQAISDRICHIEREDMYSTLKLLSDKSKFEILCLLKGKRAYGVELAKQLKLTTPTISYHMQALLNAGLVKFEKENNRLYYRLNDDYIDEFFAQVLQELKI